MTSGAATLQNGSKWCLYIGTLKTNQDERFVLSAVASRHIRSKVTRFFFNIFGFSTNKGFGSFFFSSFVTLYDRVEG